MHSHTLTAITEEAQERVKCWVLNLTISTDGLFDVDELDGTDEEEMSLDKVDLGNPELDTNSIANTVSS